MSTSPIFSTTIHARHPYQLLIDMTWHNNIYQQRWLYSIDVCYAFREDEKANDVNRDLVLPLQHALETPDLIDIVCQYSICEYSEVTYHDRNASAEMIVLAALAIAKSSAEFSERQNIFALRTVLVNGITIDRNFFDAGRQNPFKTDLSAMNAATGELEAFRTQITRTAVLFGSTDVTRMPRFPYVFVEDDQKKLKFLEETLDSGITPGDRLKLLRMFLDTSRSVPNKNLYAYFHAYKQQMRAASAFSYGFYNSLCIVGAKSRVNNRIVNYLSKHRKRFLYREMAKQASLPAEERRSMFRKLRVAKVEESEIWSRTSSASALSIPYIAERIFREDRLSEWSRNRFFDVIQKTGISSIHILIETSAEQLEFVQNLLLHMLTHEKYPTPVYFIHKFLEPNSLCMFLLSKKALLTKTFLKRLHSKLHAMQKAKFEIAVEILLAQGKLKPINRRDTYLLITENTNLFVDLLQGLVKIGVELEEGQTQFEAMCQFNLFIAMRKFEKVKLNTLRNFEEIDQITEVASRTLKSNTRYMNRLGFEKLHDSEDIMRDTEVTKRFWYADKFFYQKLQNHRKRKRDEIREIRKVLRQKRKELE